MSTNNTLKRLPLFKVQSPTTPKKFSLFLSAQISSVVHTAKWSNHPWVHLFPLGFESQVQISHGCQLACFEESLSNAFIVALINGQY